MISNTLEGIRSLQAKDNMNDIRKNIRLVRERITKAAVRVGRDPRNITLLAAGKNRSVEQLREAIEGGVDCVGENRVQELLKKIEALGNATEWHFIGHLQRNKVKFLIGKVSLIHSVDSLRLAEEISKRAVYSGTVIPVLLQINIAREKSKFGFDPEEIYEVMSEILSLKGISVLGFSSVAPFVENPEEARWVFSELRQIKERIEEKHEVRLRHLSMGMTNDFECAVEEGSTIVRIGTAIFDGL